VFWIWNSFIVVLDSVLSEIMLPVNLDSHTTYTEFVSAQREMEKARSPLVLGCTPPSVRENNLSFKRK